MGQVVAVIVAAGEGKRFGGPKQFADLGGKPLLAWSLDVFEAHPGVDGIVLVVPRGKEKDRAFQAYRKLRSVVPGGKERQDSVREGLKLIDLEKTDIVLVHDGVRPLVSQDLISRVLQKTRETGAAVPALPAKDTVKVAQGGEVVRTLDRGSLFLIQTPQGFSCTLLKEALDRAFQEGFYGTDEAMLLERLGKRVSLVEGDARNIKVTTAEDVPLAEALLGI